MPPQPNNVRATCLRDGCQKPGGEIVIVKISWRFEYCRSMSLGTNSTLSPKNAKLAGASGSDGLSHHQ